MSWRQQIVKISALFRRREPTEDLEEEIRSHLEMEERENLEAGMPPDEAQYAALRRFGNVTQAKEQSRGMWGWRWLETLLQDFRYGLRQLRRNPGFTAVAVITLALGIGANTAIFSVVDAVLLRPLPFANPHELVSVFESRPQDGIAFDGFSYPNFRECRKHQGVFSKMAGYQAHDLTLTGAGQPTIVHTIVVTPEIFKLLEVQPMAGRILLSKDGVRGAAPVVVLSENLWRSRFGEDPDMIGKSITLDQRPFTVVGIMPAAFHFPVRSEAEDVWIPLVQDPLFSKWMPRTGGHWLNVVARRRPGVSMAQARAAMDTMALRLAREYPHDNTGWKVEIESLQKQIVGPVKPALLILLGAVGLVLLIACVNIANLLLARASARTQEMAVRMAIGAGRVRILRQLLTESSLLGLIGGIAGIVLAFWGVQSLKSLLPPGLPLVNTIRVDGGVLLFALALSVAASLIFGLAPALAAARASFRATLKEGAARSGESGARRRFRGLLVAAEFALAVVLLVGAGLLIRSFTAMINVNPGFNPRRVVAAEIDLPQFQYSTPQQWNDFASESLRRIRSEPGMRDSALAIPLPIADGFVNLGFDIPGRPALAPGASRAADYAAVSPGYFNVMQILLLRGRRFGREDSPSAPPVTIISQEFARRFFPNQDPIGRQLDFGFPTNGKATRRIVGIVGDVRDVSLSQRPGPMMYVPFAQAPFWGEVVVVRSSLGTAAVATSIRRVVYGIDKHLPVTDIASLPDAMDKQASVAQPRFRTLLLGLFAALALVLAAVGIFGVMSYTASRRTHEIGIRMALGAEKKDVLKMVVGQGLKLALTGVVIGIIGALALTRFLVSLLYGVTPTDPLTFLAVSLILIAVVLVACYIPARRAAKVDPMEALRYE